jgi:hypothetical protein
MPQWEQNPAMLAYEKSAGVLRLRSRADSRLACFAQDDKTLGLVLRA